MTELSEMQEEHQIVVQLNRIETRLGTITGQLFDTHRIPEDGVDPNLIYHTPVSAILDLADAVRELKEEVAVISNYIRERKSL